MILVMIEFYLKNKNNDYVFLVKFQICFCEIWCIFHILPLGQQFYNSKISLSTLEFDNNKHRNYKYTNNVITDTAI